VTHFSVESDPIATPYRNSLARLEQSAFADALWARRLDVWSADPTTRQKVAGRLGWLDALTFVESNLARVRAFASEIQDSHFTDIVLLGMGGSSLAPEVLRQVIGVSPGWPRFRVLDSVDPTAVRDALQNAETSLFIFASKSGSTIEPNVIAAEAQRRVAASGTLKWGRHVVAITDEHTSLHRRAQAEGFRDIFVNPSDIGGRYSALSLFGIVPAALMGIDIEALLAGAARMADLCRVADPAANPGLALGAFMAAGVQSERDKLTLLLPPSLEPLGLWIEQLVGESTGKQGQGVVPIAGEGPDAPFGRDRSFVAVHLGADTPPGVDRARTVGAPLLRIDMPDTLALGAEFLRWEVATATAGMLLDINPFDEPNVQQAKDATRALLDVYTSRQRLPIREPHATIEDASLTLSSAARDRLAGADPMTFLTLTDAGDYVGLLAYLPPDEPVFEAVFERARATIGSRRSCATMFGCGPRYLHSTGQLHKGGANNGVFVIVTAPAEEDLPIPGEPFSFGVLEMAQAVGDFQSLDQAGRRTLHLHLPRRDAQLLDRIITRLVESSG
jgi:glucose-6-phosphate isomerase